MRINHIKRHYTFFHLGPSPIVDYSEKKYSREAPHARCGHAGVKSVSRVRRAKRQPTRCTALDLCWGRYVCCWSSGSISNLGRSATSACQQADIMYTDLHSMSRDSESPSNKSMRHRVSRRCLNHAQGRWNFLPLRHERHAALSVLQPPS